MTPRKNLFDTITMTQSAIIKEIKQNGYISISSTVTPKVFDVCEKMRKSGKLSRQKSKYDKDVYKYVLKDE